MARAEGEALDALLRVWASGTPTCSQRALGRFTLSTLISINNEVKTLTVFVPKWMLEKTVNLPLGRRQAGAEDPLLRRKLSVLGGRGQGGGRSAPGGLSQPELTPSASSPPEEIKVDCVLDQPEAGWAGPGSGRRGGPLCCRPVGRPTSGVSLNITLPLVTC